MSKNDLQGFRKRLLELAARLRGDIGGLTQEALRTTGGESAGGLSHVPLHMADLGTDTFEHEVATGLLQNEQAVLSAINAALERIDAGTYGKCVSCGMQIPVGRLNAVPYAQQCIECARKNESAAQE